MVYTTNFVSIILQQTKPRMKKRFFLAIAAMLTLLPSMAQQRNTFKENQLATFGAHISAGDGLMLGVQAQYHLDSPIRLEGRASTMPAFFPSLIIGVNGHYLFPMNQHITLYPLIGIEAGVGWETGYIGANFGGGMQLELTDNIFLTTEVTGLISRASSGRLTVGMHYRF